MSGSWSKSRGWWQYHDQTKTHAESPAKLDAFIHWRTTSENLYLCAELCYNARTRDRRLFETFRNADTGELTIPYYVAQDKHHAWISAQVHMLEAMSIESALKGVLVQEQVISYSKSVKGGKLGSTHDLKLLLDASSFSKKLKLEEEELILALGPYTELGRYPERFQATSVANIDFSGHWTIYTHLHAKLIEHIVCPDHWFGYSTNP